mmetsp:Transcript_46507/g.111869  ORF Transcript_46507/g.111869 Transcript_46507/m.111869 type:complete len:230 (+) Transcript_46507:256-945(+)
MEGSGYVLYHPDHDNFLTYSHVEFDPLVFPFKTQQLAGERPGTIADGRWRFCASLPPSEVHHDPDLAQFLVGKQLRLIIPRRYYPDYAQSWIVTCLQPVFTRSNVACLRLLFTGYTGPASSLPSSDRDFLTRLLHIDIPMSPVTASTPALPSTIFAPPGLTARELLAHTYPKSTFLYEMALSSAALSGTLPAHRVMAPPPVPVDPDTGAPPMPDPVVVVWVPHPSHSVG